MDLPSTEPAVRESSWRPAAAWSRNRRRASAPVVGDGHGSGLNGLSEASKRRQRRMSRQATVNSRSAAHATGFATGNFSRQPERLYPSDLAIASGRCSCFAGTIGHAEQEREDAAGDVQC